MYTIHGCQKISNVWIIRLKNLFVMAARLYYTTKQLKLNRGIVRPLTFEKASDSTQLTLWMNLRTCF